MKTLYVHIGTPKTGTSALQDFLTNNAAVLGKYGFCYKLMPYRYTRDASIKRNGHFLVGKIYDEQRKVDKEARGRRIREGLEIVREWFQTVDSVILSDEGIWNTLATRTHGKILSLVKDFCDENGYALKIIVYLRSQDDYVVSWWGQRIRSGSKLREWDYFIDHLPPKKLVTDYYSQLCRIADDVGKENIIVRRYEKGSFRGSAHTIFSDFLDALGLEYTDEYQVVQEYVNTSLETNYAEIKRILNGLLPDENQPFGKMSRYFEEIAVHCSNLPGIEQYRSSMFSNESHAEFMGRYEEGNRKIVTEFMGEEGELFHPQPESDLPKWERQNPRQYDDLLLFIGEAFLRQRDETGRLEDEISTLKEELRKTSHELAVQSKKLEKLMKAPKEKDTAGQKQGRVGAYARKIKNEIANLK